MIKRWIRTATTQPKPPAAPATASPPSEAIASAAGVSPTVWENLICLNAGIEPAFTVLGPAADYLATDARRDMWAGLDYAEALRRDTWPLPQTADREGYFGDDHFSYWASGFQDALLLLDAARQHGVTPRQYLDLGCASGRVLRHVALGRPDVMAMGCDINRLHVEWCNRYLPSNCTVFQNHSIPSLPLPDASVDIVSAYSVFTHIEALETAWLMELRRILRPGGVAWITVHSEFTLQEMTPDWPLWAPTMQHPAASRLIGEDRRFEGDRLVLRWLADRSYSSNVFYRLDYIRQHWSRILEVREVRRRCPSFQDVVILGKPG